MASFAAKLHGGEEGEKWVKHYCSKHQILLVGEGDFSFSLSLAHSFGSASNMLSTSLDPLDAVIRKYKNARSNLENLNLLGASISHGVDATRMKLHPDLRMRKFDRIIFNFPHAGFHGKEDNALVIGMHRKLVHGFLNNACAMLRADGEIHINHKTTGPFCNWGIVELANRNSLVLTECVDFKKEDYPGYNQKRGDGLRCDQPFPLGMCGTFIFTFYRGSANANNNISRLHINRSTPKLYPFQEIAVPTRLNQFEEVPLPQHRLITSLDQFSYSRVNQTANMNHHVQLPPTVSAVNRSYSSPWGIKNRAETSCAAIGFGAGLELETSGFESIDGRGFSAYAPSIVDYERRMAEVRGRTLNGDIYMLREIERAEVLRSVRLRRIMSQYEQFDERALTNCSTSSRIFYQL